MQKEIIVRWKIREAETAAVLELLPSLVEATRNEEGNLFYNIFQSDVDPNELILHEGYADADAALFHRETEHYKEIVAGKIVPCLELREVTIVRKLY